MKFLILVFYFFRSVALRGFINTVRLLRAELSFEKKLGIHTSTFKKSKSDEFFHYQGASYLVLCQIFTELFEQTKHLNFVDIGCGKGRVIFIADYSGYKHLTGIELDPELIKEALQNEQRYKLRNNSSTIKFVHVNALDYSYKNLPTLYFLFNPFNEDVLRNVLDKIIAASTCETWFVYMNPLFVKPFHRKNIEQVRHFKTGSYLEATIYRLNPVSVRS